MKLLIENLPQNDLRKICELLAATVPVPFIKLFILNGEIERKRRHNTADTCSASAQGVTAVNPEHLPDLNPETSLLIKLWQASELQVVEDIYTVNDPKFDSLKAENNTFQSFLWQPFNLNLPAGLLVNDNYEGLALKSLDSHELPALQIVTCPAILCLADTQSRTYSASMLGSVQSISGLLEKIVHQWTSIQHEQEKLRKLRHDLRTPLTSMTMLPDLIKSVPGMDDESVSMCEQLKLAARKLDQILTDSAREGTTPSL